MPLIYPLINGVRFSWSSVIVSVGKAQFLGVKSVNFDENVDPATIHGTGQNIIGTTAGMYNATGDIEFYAQEADALVAALNIYAVAGAASNKGGWMNKPVLINVQYIDDEQPTVSKKLLVRLSGRTQGGSESPEALTSKFKMTFLAPIDDNGISAIPSIDAARFVNVSI